MEWRVNIIEEYFKMRVVSVTISKLLSDNPELNEKRPYGHWESVTSEHKAGNTKSRVNIPKLHWLKEQPKSPRGTNTFCPQLVVSNIVREKVHGSGQNEFYHILRTITWSSKCCRHGGTCHWAPCCHYSERTRARKRGWH